MRKLKAELNRIYRKQRKIKASAEEGDAQAMAILDYSYRTSRHVFELDNNTLTLEELTKSQNELRALQEKFGVSELPDYQPERLDTY